MDSDFRTKFLLNRDETGREVVYSIRTKVQYFVESIGDGRGGDWGSENPSTKEIEHKKGDGKYTGSITADQSIITEENGFELIHNVPAGQSVYDYINEVDSKY